jgi:protein N-terminal methyltransferase
MLGNLLQISLPDVQGSLNFLKQVFKLKPAPPKNRCLDCGAGIGRVSKNVLMQEFTTVDLVEQDPKFCEKAKESLINSGHLGNIYNVGLQDFKESSDTYDVIWIQWVLLYLPDEALIDFFTRISGMLNKNGLIIVKENFTKGNEVIFDKEDSSVTRPMANFKALLKQSNLRIIKEQKQTNFPKELFPVYMLAIRPMK